jgi:hypothetical protein
LAKTGGSGTTVIGCNFNPDGGAGTIRVATGTLAFNGLVSNFYGPISGAGTFSIGGGGATRSTPAPPSVPKAGPLPRQAPM